MTKRTPKPRLSATKSKSPPKRARGKGGSQATGKAAIRAGESARSVGDWRAQTLEDVGQLIREADPEIVIERKWVKPSNPSGVPVWCHAGIVCTGETYKQVVKLTFARGASLKDPKKLFNSSLDGSTRRAIDIREGEELDAGAFKALIQAAVAENLRSGAPKSKSSKGKGSAKSKSSPSMGKRKPLQKGEGGVVLLSGGNPQIAKGDGDAPVQAYIAAMPGWKSGLGRVIDAVIVRSVPNVRKAVKWNSPFYGLEGQGWFLGMHVFTRYLKVTFFRGTSLRPKPPGGTERSKDSRWIDIYEDDEFDEAQFASWVKQAAALPGWVP